MQTQLPPYRNPPPIDESRRKVREHLGLPAEDRGFMPGLVAFTGFLGSGKDTAAAVLLEQYGFTKVAFGDGVKDALMAIGFSRESLHDPLSKQLPVGWLESGVTPRQAMQTLGTEWGRQMVDPDLWVRVAENKLALAWKDDPLAKFAMTDVRFPNEIQMARDMNATIIHIRRGKMTWWRRLLARFGHKSERVLPVRPGDYVVQNDGTVEDLHRRVLAACYGRIEEGVTRG